MRLWHQELLPLLPRQQLLGQHRECCALRGNGWGRKHSVVNYVFTHDPALLVGYHYRVMREMERRGYRPSAIWDFACWRGDALGEDHGFVDRELLKQIEMSDGIIYPEHNSEYLKECIENLRAKGIDITFG